MKDLVNTFLYLIVSTIVIIITLLIIINIEPINHTHDKELEELLTNKIWTTKKYFNDELLDIVLIFNKDNKTITYEYSNNLPVNPYYQICNNFLWSKEKRTLDINCDNENYENSTIEVISITENKLELKMKDEYIQLKAVQ